MHHLNDELRLRVVDRCAGTVIADRQLTATRCPQLKQVVHRCPQMSAVAAVSVGKGMLPHVKCFQV